MPLTLTLEVTGPQAAQFGSRGRRVFEGKGGSVGRSEDCDWVLAASGVSRVHAMVRHLNGMYFIEDKSTNGMLLNGAPLVKGDPAALNNGDRLLIDTFEISVQLAEAAPAAAPPPASPSMTQPFAAPSAAPPAYAPPPPPAYAAPPPPAARAPANEDPFDFDFLGPPSGAAPAPSPMPAAPPAMYGAGAGSGIDDLIPGAARPAAEDLDPLSFLGPLGAPAAPAPPAQSWNHTPGINDAFRPPSSTSSFETRQTSTLPDNWDLTMGDFAPKPAARPAPPPAPSPPQPQPPRPAPPAAPAAALPADVDAIFRIVVEGVMDVLRARAEIKNTFRLPVTIIQRAENNPLKFAPNADEALRNILQPSSGGAFLSGVSAFQDAFDDIRCHQMAMLAGVRAAFTTMLAHFSPERYEGEGDAARRGGFMDFGKGGKVWEKYRENFEALNRNPDDAFRRLFGDEFARAYEEQLSRLKSARRMQQAAQR